MTDGPPGLGPYAKRCSGTLLQHIPIFRKLFASHVFKRLQQIVRRHRLLSFGRYVQHDLAFVHHDEAVSET